MVRPGLSRKLLKYRLTCSAQEKQHLLEARKHFAARGLTCELGRMKERKSLHKLRASSVSRGHKDVRVQKFLLKQEHAEETHQI